MWCVVGACRIFFFVHFLQNKYKRDDVVYWIYVNDENIQQKIEDPTIKIIYEKKMKVKAIIYEYYSFDSHGTKTGRKQSVKATNTAQIELKKMFSSAHSTKATLEYSSVSLSLFLSFSLPITLFDSLQDTKSRIE